MATYYVTCIEKYPTHDDPHHSIQAVGTNTDRASTNSDKRWTAAQVESAIQAKTDSFYSENATKTKTAKVIVVTRDGKKYIKTENDGDMSDNLLKKPECK
jgi:hypothetical protein